VHARMALERRCRGTIHAGTAESQVWDAVMRLLEQPELIADAVAKRQATMHEQEAGIDEELRAVERALARSDEEDRRLVEAYMAGAFTAAELKAYRADVAAKRQSVEAHRQELLGRRAALQQTMGQTAALVDYCARVRERLQTFSLEETHCAFDALALQVT
jgi:hypothetical protein